MIVDIIRLDSFGRGICYVNDKICFVANSFPGEKVKIEITHETSKFMEGRFIEVIEKSRDRVESYCPYSNCGGCSFCEYSYSSENQYKENKIKDLVTRRLKLDDRIVLPILYDKELFYRNKIILHGDGSHMGLYQPKSNDILPITSCHLVLPVINELIPLFTDLKDTDEVLIRCSNDQKHILISVLGKGEYDFLEEHCDSFIVNQKVLKGNDYILTSIGSKEYRLSSSSFFQINSFLTTKMFDIVYSYVEKFKPNCLLDLYCGTGTFGIYVSNLCKQIIGVDYNSSNILDAKENAKINQVENIEFICDTVESVIDTFNDVDCILVDPARSGLDTKTRSYINKILPQHIIYVSCNPDTLIRDLDDFKAYYNVLSIQPINFFPKTYHCENVCILERR